MNKKKSSCSSGPLIAFHDRCYVRNKRYKLQMVPTLCRYQAGMMDRIYLRKLNKKRAEVRLPTISESIFRRIIEKFEIICYEVCLVLILHCIMHFYVSNAHTFSPYLFKAIHYDLLAPFILPTEAANTEFDENACCDICRQVSFALLRQAVLG